MSSEVDQSRQSYRGDRFIQDKTVIQTFTKSAPLNPNSGRGIPLRIGIDKQGSIAPLGDNRRQIDCRRGLSDSAFLVCDSYYFGHYWASEPS